MFLDFLQGKKKILSRRDFLDLAESYDDILFNRIKNDIDELLPISLLPISENKYCITSRDKSYTDVIILVDESSKILYVNASNLLSDIFMYYSFEVDKVNFILKSNIEEYKIVDYNTEMSNMITESGVIVEQYLEENYSKLFNNIKKDKDCYDFNFRRTLFNVYVKEYTLDIPSLFANKKNFNIDYYIKYVETYLFNKKLFKKEIISLLNNNISDKYSSSLIDYYIYLTVKKIIKNNEIPFDLVHLKQIQKALDQGGKTVNVIYEKDGEICNEKCKTSLHLEGLQKANNYGVIKAKDVLEITFGRKVLYKK